MKKWAQICALALFLTLGGLSLATAAPDTAPRWVLRTAFAQNTPGGLNRLEAKMNDVQVLVRKILYVFTGIGIAFCGFRFLQGDPNAWKYTMTVVIGATIIFASGEIMSWLER